LERQVALFAGDRADTVDGALFGVNDRVHTLRVQGTGNWLGRVIVGLLFFFAPQLTLPAPASVALTLLEMLEFASTSLPNLLRLSLYATTNAPEWLTSLWDMFASFDR
jgi:hypothetical protein